MVLKIHCFYIASGHMCFLNAPTTYISEKDYSTFVQHVEPYIERRKA